MWIRSQDGTELVDINQVVIEGNKIICCKWVLGEYRTSARTFVVLDEIHDRLNDFKNGYREVFEMPQE